MRTFDPTVLNRIANHPEVKPYFGHEEGEIFFDECASLPDDYVLLDNGKDAGAIFEWTGPGIWQGHYLSLPVCRGRAALAEFSRMIDWMFEHEGARLIWGQTPEANRAARWVNRQLGMVSQGFRVHHASGLCELFVVER